MLESTYFTCLIKISHTIIRVQIACFSGGSELSGFTFEQYYQQVRNFQQPVESAMVDSGTSHFISE